MAFVAVTPRPELAAVAVVVTHVAAKLSRILHT